MRSLAFFTFLYLIFVVNNPYFILTISFFPLHFNFFSRNRINYFSYVLSLYGKVAVKPPVNQNQQFNIGRPAKIEDGIQSRADSPPGIKHIINQNNIFPFQAKLKYGFVCQQRFSF